MKKVIILFVLLCPILLFGQTIMKADSLYKIEKIDYGGSSGGFGGMLLYGDSIRVNILGSQILPDSTDTMVDLYQLIIPVQDTSRIDTCGAYFFPILPRYIHFKGTVDGIVLLGYKVKENLGAFD